jgi:serine/threonine protein phosphatase PrpC
MEQPASMGKLEPIQPRGSILELQLAENKFVQEEQKRVLGISPARPLDASGKRKTTVKEEETEENVNAVVRCGYKTHTGSVMGKKKKHNQDSCLIEQKLLGLRGQYLFAVCDGHGAKGHKVSALIKQSLSSKVCASLQENPPPCSLSTPLRNGVRSLVSLVESSDIDLHFSGSTLVAVLIRGRKLACANIGDSRAVLGSCNRQDRWQAVELSNDHKPVRSDEARRIAEAGGVIRQFQTAAGESIGPLRVWAREKDVPGLAMTRSIGDLASKKNGIWAEPEVREWEITEEDKFLIIATDGVWEFISSMEAVEIVKDVWGKGKSEACCEKLVEEARRRWEKENVEDDITVVVAFLNVR